MFVQERRRFWELLYTDCNYKYRDVFNMYCMVFMHWGSIVYASECIVLRNSILCIDIVSIYTRKGVGWVDFVVQHKGTCNYLINYYNTIVKVYLLQTCYIQSHRILLHLIKQTFAHYYTKINLVQRTLYHVSICRRRKRGNTGALHKNSAELQTMISSIAPRTSLLHLL